MTRRAKLHTAPPAHRRGLRIIGGAWRGRRLDFPETPGLRPTPDRVRETLFNWLQGLLEGSRCLDLFAGSGALGFEALSRGAAQVVMVDADHAVIANLRHRAERLQAQAAEIVQADALGYLRAGRAPFDIVFLDPPFGADLTPRACQMLDASALLKPAARIYIEHHASESPPPLPENWDVLRNKRAGQVAYRLAAPAAAPSLSFRP